ncbi:T-complex protein 1 subunit eta, partial [Symbiodinium microadriaticum]
GTWGGRDSVGSATGASAVFAVEAMAGNMMKPQIILLKDGTDSSQGKAQIISNINACQAVVNIVKSTLGPRGMDKLLEDGSSTTITNDGATVMKKLNIVHPAARILVDISKAQDNEVGDGTTSVVVLAGELLKEAKHFLEDGLVAPQIIKGYRMACNLAVSKLLDMAVDLKDKSPEEKRSMLVKCAETTLNSKQGTWERSGAPGWSRDNWGDSWSSWAGNQQRPPLDDSAQGHRRNSAQSMTASTELPASTEDHEAEGVDDQDPRDSDLGSGSTRKDVPKTGKDHVPEFSGSTTMREYQRRVRLFEASTGIDASYRAQKLMERLSGQAWLATESLDLSYIKHPDGVERLLQHLWQELEPLEYVRTFTTLTEFYKGCRRTPGMEYLTYDMEFRTHLKRLEEVGAKVEGLNRAYWFIEKAGLSAELRKQVVAAAGGEYDYVKLRRALLAIVPKVNREEDGFSSRPTTPANRQWKPRANQPPRQVHATIEEDGDEAAPDDQDQDAASLEGELEVLLTQAARKRSQIERARGFAKSESQQDREKRIREMKAKMACSACKSHGKTVFGHWHSDAACPYNKNHQSGSGDKSVLAVVEAQLTDSESDQDELLGPQADDVYMATALDDRTEGEPMLQEEVWVGDIPNAKPLEMNRFTLALTDTCCARTVAGENWMQRHVRHLHRLREDTYVVEEARPFRFGAGPRVMSMYSVIVPVNIPGAQRWAHLRVSVVKQDVPLLISKAALKKLGVVLDLAGGKVQLGQLGTHVPLRETSAGLCGFDINVEPSRRRCMYPDPILVGENEEVVVSSFEQYALQDVMMTHGEDGNAAGGAPGGLRRATSQAIQECEMMAKQLLDVRDFSYGALLDLVRRLPQGRRHRHRHINDGQGPSNVPWTVGLYAHGNQIGVTRRTVRYPHVVKYLNMFMRNRTDMSWSSLTVHRDVATEVHRDVHNDKQACSTTVTFGDFRQGQLWLALAENEPNDRVDVVWKQDKNGKWIPGRLVDTRERPFEFNPHIPHATHEWTGERWCLTVYKVRDTDQVDSSTRRALARLRFPFGRRTTSRTPGDKEPNSFDTLMSSSNREPQERRDDIDRECVVAPKRKEEYVQAIACWSKVSVTELREHTVDRLRELYAVLKPKKRMSVLPPSWKKLDLESLKELYASRVVTDLDRPSDGHWNRWTRSQLILEVDLWNLDVQSTMEYMPDNTSPFPVCEECGIPMITRTNRVSKEEFWGCRRFPACRVTLPMMYGDQPVQEAIADFKKIDKQMQMPLPPKTGRVKEEKAPKPEGILPGRRKNKAGYPPKEGMATSSDGSWVRTGTTPLEEISSGDEETGDRKFNTNLTAEELEAIKQMRTGKGGAARADPTENK